MPLLRQPQGVSRFTPGDPHSGYYNDLTVVIPAGDGPEAGRRRAAELTADRRSANPVSIAQLGLAAWQSSELDRGWLDTVEAVAQWLVSEMEPDGSIRVWFDMAHTYDLRAGWTSAMAQGEAASLLVRAASSLDRPELTDAAVRAVATLLRGDSPLVAGTPEGPVLQEYPTTPPAHVLNGWIYALWGLYDVGIAARHAESTRAFEQGVETLAARLPRYSLALGWSRYDLYPHRLPNAASPYYHRLHVALLSTLGVLSPHPELTAQAERWARANRNPVSFALGVARKSAFRVVIPRRRRARTPCAV
jgi:hypothetical protein